MNKLQKKILSTCKKTTIFQVFDKKTSKTRLSKFLKLRSLLFVNDCFKSESNAVFGVFLQRLLMFLIVLAILTPTGILLPMVFDANDAWGEWSAATVKNMIGYVPEGLQKYSDTYKAPVPDYTFNAGDSSITHQSLFYILSGIAGIALTFGVTVLISKFIIKNGK